MALPLLYDDYDTYFTDAVEFLEKYQCIFNYPNTKILVRRVFEMILQCFGNSVAEDIRNVKDWLSTDDITNEKLREFVLVLNKLRPPECTLENNESLNGFEVHRDIPLSPKKHHEILRLSEKIHSICLETNTDTVVELGSGLGYLTQMLNQSYNLKVLGFEATNKFVENSIVRQKKFHKDSLGNVFFHCHFISTDSGAFIERKLRETFGVPNEMSFCLTGLHACADLTVDAIRLFFEMECASSLIIMPCCYHKMSMVHSEKFTSDCEVFTNFPLSECLREVWTERDGQRFLRRPFLRLASQPKLVSDDDDLISFNLLSRAFLEQYSLLSGLSVIRRKRRPVCKEEAKRLNITSFFHDAVHQGYKFTSIATGDDIIPDPAEVVKSWDTSLKPEWSGMARTIVVLQRLLQPICENLVLLDRLAFTNEMGFSKAQFVRVTNPKISPRCWALVVKRNTLS